MSWAPRGERTVIAEGDPRFPEAFRTLRRVPSRLYLAGDERALAEGLAVVGARKATPYGLGCASRFATLASRRGICIVSGGARGCDSQAHTAALENGAPTVVFLGCGIDHAYPAENRALFQRIMDNGGALVSEHPWDTEPRPWMFRERNRLIASLAKATLIVEAGLPSGTFSTADYALEANREVMAIPGSITSKASMGANLLISQGATPVIDDESFSMRLDALFGTEVLRCGSAAEPKEARSSGPATPFDRVARALEAQPMSLEAMLGMVSGDLGEDALPRLMLWLADQRRLRMVAKYPDGTYGPMP